MIFTLWKLNMCKTCLALDGLDVPSYECKVKSTKLFRVRKFAILLNDLGLNSSDISQWTQKLNWRYIRRSHSVLNVIWTLMYVQFKQCVHGVSFFTLRHLIFMEISVCDNCVWIHFREFHSLLAKLRKFISVMFVLFSVKINPFKVLAEFVI